ncbi:TOG array regulator of axonemal microtubules protein 1-like [Brachyhypopomus gauderio]|uniref:TOG array regulator of axonemal microtubules protein 1-like n=1 Tax=Brachyhypopomus gauderio TaxID=698409 RepID=UPI0040428BB0
MKRSLRHTVRDVSPDDAAPLKAKTAAEHTSTALQTRQSTSSSSRPCWVQKTSASPSRALISWWPTARTTHIWSWATCSWYLMLSKHDCKVNLYALEALQKIITLLRDNLVQVVYILVPAILDNHLNSKNNAIYMATIGAIQALINNLELVRELYPCKPQLVEQKVLPLLWYLLGTSSNSGTVHGRGGSVRGATVHLCQALHAHMGPALLDCAASQPSNIRKSLREFVKNLPIN